MLAAHKRVNFSRLLPAKISITRQVIEIFAVRNRLKFPPLLNHSIMRYFLNVKTNFVLNVYDIIAPGACREAADFHSRPFASAGGGYVNGKYFCRLL